MSMIHDPAVDEDWRQVQELKKLGEVTCGQCKWSILPEDDGFSNFKGIAWCSMMELFVDADVTAEEMDCEAVTV